MPHVSTSLLSWAELPAAFSAFPGSENWLGVLQRHWELLGEARAVVRTTAVGDEEAPAKLYAESLELLRIAIDRGGDAPVVDVGPGGGFPGLVIAAVIPEWTIVLVEALQKRARLLESMAHELGMGNVVVVSERAEVAGHGAWRERAGLVTARAVAPTRELLEYTAPFARPGGVLALAKGSSAPAELAESGPALAALGCGQVELVATRPEVSATPWVMVARKVTPTRPAYPRRAGMPHKRPL